MKVNSAVILATLKKDLRCLMMMVLVVIGVLTLEAFVMDLSLNSVGQSLSLIKQLLPYISMVACGILIVAVFQQDPAASVNHDWLTRPISKLDLLLAKLLFLVATILIPMIIARLVVNLVNGYSMGESLLEATVFETSWTLLVIPFIMAIAILYGSLVQAIGALLVVFTVLLLFAWLGSVVPSSPDSLGDDAISFGASWIKAVALLGLESAALGVAYWFQYHRRDARRARIAVAATTVLSICVMILPFHVPAWGFVFAVLQSTVGDPDKFAEQLNLDSAYACYPASAIDMSNDGKGASDEAKPARQIIGAPYWEEDYLRRAGVGAFTYTTLVTSRNVPPDWRVLPLKVTATYSSDSLSEVNKRRPANAPAAKPYSQRNAVANYWLVPEDLKLRTISDPSTKVRFDYSLALLAPTRYTLEIDGVRRRFPKVGYCSALENAAKNQVEVACFKRGQQPTVVSAEFVNVPASRVDAGAPNFSPKWLDTFDGQHYDFVIQSASLVSKPTVLLTAYESKAYVNKQVITPGLLGGPAAVCPPPDASRLSESQWSDASPHKSSFIVVDQGVRLEVLEWTSPARMDGKKPRTLVLLAGAGATAHYYDDLAPELAEKYRVIGITRRGFGGSSKPDFGYDIVRLGEDVMQVLNTLGIESPVLVGHSFGGDEVTQLGARYPHRFAGLIYLDAAYDRSKSNSKEKDLMAMLPPMPRPTPAETGSRTALQPYLDRIHSVGLPEGEIMASMDLAAGGRKYDERHAQAMMSGVIKPEYDKIVVPALAMYAVPSSVDKAMEPWYDKNDPRAREAVGELYRIRSAYQAAQIEQFKTRVVHSEVIVIKDADHSIFISNRDDVVRAMEGFIGKLTSR